MFVTYNERDHEHVLSSVSTCSRQIIDSFLSFEETLIVENDILSDMMLFERDHSNQNTQEVKMNAV